jgi:quercetin dioxygenase-like cupin family protein
MSDFFMHFDDLKKDAFGTITSAIGSKVQGERMVIGLARKAAGTGSKPHRHPVEQFNYIIQGIMKAEVDGEVAVVPAGGLVRIPPNVLHSFVAAGDEEVVFLSIKDKGSEQTTGIPEDGIYDGPRLIDEEG